MRGTKRLVSVVAVWLCAALLSPAARAQQPGAQEALKAAYPGTRVESSSQWGSTLAAVLLDGGSRTLAILEKNGEIWQVRADNARLPHAARASVHADTDETVFLSLQAGDRHITWDIRRMDGQWCLTAVDAGAAGREDGEARLQRTLTVWENGVLSTFSTVEDENENILYWSPDRSVPARWMAGERPLSRIDPEQMPWLDESAWDYAGWPGHEALKRSAQEITPNYLFLSGACTNFTDGLQYMAQRPDGRKVLVCARYEPQKGVWHTQESAPLPDDAVYGPENLIGCLMTRDSLCAVGREGDGWGLRWIGDHSAMDVTRIAGPLILGPEGQCTAGDHPWGRYPYRAVAGPAPFLCAGGAARGHGGLGAGEQPQPAGPPAPAPAAGQGRHPRQVLQRRARARGVPARGLGARQHTGRKRLDDEKIPGL